MPRCCLLPACRVELGHELAVGGPCCGEVLVAFAELDAHVGDLLLESVVVVLERVDVGRGAEPGFPPRVLAEECGEPALELLDAGGQPGGSLLGVEQVGLQRGTARRGPGARRGRRVCLGHVDLFEQVAVPVEECPVNAGAMLVGLISCPAAVAALMAWRTRARRRAESAWRPRSPGRAGSVVVMRCARGGCGAVPGAAAAWRG